MDVTHSNERDVTSAHTHTHTHTHIHKNPPPQYSMWDGNDEYAPKIPTSFFP